MKPGFIIQCEHIYFIPNSMVKNPSADNGIIYVFTSRNNNRNYKRKKIDIGIIFYNKKVKQWVFYPHKEINGTFLSDTLMIITLFLGRLNKGVVKYDSKEGAFKEKPVL